MEHPQAYAVYYHETSIPQYLLVVPVKVKTPFDMFISSVVVIDGTVTSAIQSTSVPAVPASLFQQLGKSGCARASDRGRFEVEGDTFVELKQPGHWQP